jgi:putative FmdB family regulatory protein
MPTYEYRCDNGHTFEMVQRMNDKPAAKCPECGAKAARVISGGQGLIFKGSGFYITDYGKDGKGPRKDADAPAAAKSDSAAPAAEKKAESKSEPKSEAKSEAKPAAAPPKPDAK